MRLPVLSCLLGRLLQYRYLLLVRWISLGWEEVVRWELLLEELRPACQGRLVSKEGKREKLP